ncbi:MAG: hypothetical protein FJ215_01775 [Ignavibacteria bacterium]|nr:hypothetical protein [Ignavibacteria bacterium]
MNIFRFLIYSAVAAAGFLLGCERDLPIDPSSREVEGYLIEGRVTNRFGIPLTNIDIRLDFDLILVDQNDPAPRYYIVRNPGEFVTVVVQEDRGGTVRTLASNNYPGGRIEYAWDEKLPGGELAPSGLYHVRYLVNGQPRYSYPVLVTNTVTARTNAEGLFVIPDRRLPIGYEPVPVYGSNNSFFYGNHRVGTRVFLGFLLGGRTRVLSVHPSKNRATRFDVIIN